MQIKQFNPVPNSLQLEKEISFLSRIIILVVVVIIIIIKVTINKIIILNRLKLIVILGTIK